MGLIDKLIFKPWFKAIHDEDNILSLNPQYKTFREELEELTEDPTPLMDGSCVCLPQYPPTQDEIFKSLTTAGKLTALCGTFFRDSFSRQAVGINHDRPARRWFHPGL